jgi:hypothetical protein
MKKTIFALAAATTLAIGTLSALTTADARCYGCAVGAGVAAGVIGGAIIGGAIASSRPAYAAPAPVYVEEAPPCRMVRERFWDGYGWRFRRIEVCN